MRKNNFVLVVFLILGFILGSIVSRLLISVEFLSFLTHTTSISWSPKANFDFLIYEFMIRIKVNLLHFIGLITAIVVYRKM